MEKLKNMSKHFKILFTLVLTLKKLISFMFPHVHMRGDCSGVNL